MADALQVAYDQLDEWFEAEFHPDKGQRVLLMLFLAAIANAERAEAVGDYEAAR